MWVCRCRCGCVGIGVLCSRVFEGRCGGCDGTIYYSNILYSIVWLTYAIARSRFTLFYTLLNALNGVLISILRIINTLDSI